MAPATWLLGLMLAAAVPKESPKEWLGEELPLPLPVRTPDDLAFKQVAERQYLQFNLLVAGKAAYDRGDMATAAARWETLLAVPDLPADLERIVRPLATEARSRAGGAPRVTGPEPAKAGAVAAGVQAPAPPVKLATVRGEVSGGGNLGPGGTVLWLTRSDGPTPKVKPGTSRTIAQRGKQFTPRILAVPVGTTVHFRNDDEVFHNVFSLSRPNDFDLGLYKSGISREQTFRTPGPVNLLCNIHASMVGYVYVVDSPYYAQADVTGAWSVRNVPPGEYVLHAWHETSLEPVSRRLSVRADTTTVPVIAINSDRPPMTLVPDKAGKPRQNQLGY